MLDADASLHPRSDAVISETMGGETMVIDTESGVFYSLRGVASAMWLAVESGMSATDLAAALQARYPEVEAPHTEVAGFLAPLTQDGVVTVGDAPTSATAPLAWPDTYSPAVVERHGDMNDLLLVDPLHDVDDTGWPRRIS